MRTREATQAAPQAGAYSTAGFSFFQIAGFVQDVKTNDKLHCDYIRFNIQCKQKPEYFDIVSVTLPHSVGVVAEIGDAVIMRGYVRAWNRGGNITLELVAERAEPVDPEKLERSKAR